MSYHQVRKDWQSLAVEGAAPRVSLSAGAVKPLDDPLDYLEGTSECVFLLDSSWRFTFLNTKAQQEIAHERVLIGKVIWDEFKEARGTAFEEYYTRAMTQRVRMRFEAAFDPLSATYEIHVTPLSGGGIGVWFRNINERKMITRELADTAERYRLAARATNDLIWDWDFSTDIVQWNEALDERLGYHPPDLGSTAEWWLNRIHPDDRARVSQEVHDAIEGKAPTFNSEYRFLRADGTYADIFDRGYVLRDEAGLGVRMVGAMQDYSERKRAVAAIREQQTQLSTVFGQAMVGIMQTGPDGHAIMANRRFCELVGRTEEELKRCSVTDYTHPDDLSWNLPLLKRHRQSGESFQIEKRYLKPDGTIVWCEVSVSFVKNEEDAVVSAIVVAQDITARKIAEEQVTEKSSLLQNVIDGVSDLIFVKDRSGKFILANRALNEACGKLIGLRAADLLPDDLTPAYQAIDDEVISTGTPRSVEEEIPVRGERRQFQTAKVPWICDGEIAGVIGVSRDITERKAAETALRESELLYRSVLEASQDCIKVIDLCGRIRLMNTPGQRAMGFEKSEQFVGIEWSSFWPTDGRTIAERALARAKRGKVTRFSGYCPTPCGTKKWWDVLVSPMRNSAGEVTQILAISRDITVQRDTSEQLRWASEHDSLTSLPNRRAFKAHLQAASIRAMESGGSVGLLLLDLDHFKHINDSLGHAAGDHLLQTFGKRLIKGVRAQDFVARLGGDEFAVILEGDLKPEDLLRTGDAILARLNRPIAFGGRVMSAGASIGGSLYPSDAENALELFNNADTALYALKVAGRGGTRMFHQHMREQAQKAASQLAMARMAISAKTVEPHYQPKVELRNGRVRGFEALLRWRGPSGVLQLPEAVSEAFKDYELATKIGELMQQRVFSDMRDWIEGGTLFGIVAINAAPAEFLRDDFAERLLCRLREHEIPPHMLEVEVTEHVFFDQTSDYVSRALKCLKEAGVRIALDDFGTGYSSLSHLRDFSVDVVKIDQSFVEKMTKDDEIKAIVSAIIGLAASLGIEVVAEGVETRGQKALLLERDCDLGQGHFFGRPVHAAMVPSLFKQHP